MVPTHQSNLDSLLVGYVIYMMSLPPFAYGAGLNLFFQSPSFLFHESPGLLYSRSTKAK
jgi:glycerol-3-phosphate O-acyltransferase